MNVASRIRAAAIALLVLWFIVAMYLQRDVGLADNGDFLGQMGWISSGPVGISSNVPAAGTEDWSRRFFNYWIPFWKLQWTVQRPTSSAILLWLPGAWLNTLLYSNTVLYLPFLSLVPRLILLGVLLLVLRWASLHPRYAIILLFGLGVPAVLLFTTTAYVVFLNSFYREPASEVFLILLLCSVVLLARRRSPFLLMCSLACVLLLATSKPSTLYWPVVAVPFVWHVWSRAEPIRANVAILVNALLILVLATVAAFVTQAGSNKFNGYHSFFRGALVFSDRPTVHLRDMGMSTATECIRKSAYLPIGAACFTKYGATVSFESTAVVIYREPLVMLRMLKYTLDHMQRVSLPNLGRYSFDDPRSRMSSPLSREALSSEATAGSTWLDLWSRLKMQFFPRGYALFAVLAILIVWFCLKLGGAGIQRELALVGVITTIGCMADMLVAILGEGISDFTKHLFLSNVLCDIALVVFVNSLLITCFELIGAGARGRVLRKSARSGL